ncbi:MAG: glycoside hydrolase family 32 protein [Planctomycetes bacterium]|nr:glycoside hydrolase family 32 protein [Planctomycetota bacterium]
MTIAPRDPHRPGYHFMPPKNWMNDPNGLIQFRGRYHIFYQHNPNAAVWGDMHWGHAVSDDMVRWKHLPPAIAPTPGGYDKDGVFSGCCVDFDGRPAALYTGISPEVQCLAFADDPNDPDLRTWTKHAGNPVIPAPPRIGELTGFRDPYVWREADGWHMAVGSGLRSAPRGPLPRGCVLLYRSTDLVNWEYLHTLCEGDANEGEMWECPNFFELDGKHVLLIAGLPSGKSVYLVGDYRDKRFSPRLRGEIDAGGSLYAPQVFTDAKGRGIMFGWLRETRPISAQAASGWACAQTLPRVLTLGDDGALRYAPAEEVRSLRLAGPGDHRTWVSVPWSGDHTLALHADDTIEIEAVFDPPRGETGLAVRRSPDGSEQTRITWSPVTRRLTLDMTRGSLDATTQRDRREAPLSIEAGEPLRLRVFVDRSIIEVFANDRACLTGRVYPTRNDALGVALASNGPATLSRLDLWRLDPVLDCAAAV